MSVAVIYPTDVGNAHVIDRILREEVRQAVAVWDARQVRLSRCLGSAQAASQWWAEDWSRFDGELL